MTALWTGRLASSRPVNGLAGLAIDGVRHTSRKLVAATMRRPAAAAWAAAAHTAGDCRGFGTAAKANPFGVRCRSSPRPHGGRPGRLVRRHERGPGRAAADRKHATGPSGSAAVCVIIVPAGLRQSRAASRRMCAGGNPFRQCRTNHILPSFPSPVSPPTRHCKGHLP